MRAQDFPVETLIDGVQASEDDCRSTPNGFWLVVDGYGDCIRYYTSDAQPGKTAIFYIHGDRLALTANGEESSGYVDNCVAAQQEQVRWIAASVGVPVIKIARPGTYGSSGEHTQRRQMRELTLVNNAITRLKERFGIEHAAVVGQSGGGTIAAYLLTRQPTLSCVVLAFAGLSILTEGAPAYNNAPGVYNNAPGVYDPIAHVRSIMPNAARRVFVVGDARDTVSPIANQCRYAAALHALGHNVAFLNGAAPPPDFHTLDRTGLHIGAWSLEGVSADDIVKRVSAGALRS